MITLNTDKGLVSIESWEDIIQLPGYTRDLNPEKIKLKEITGKYSLKEKISCGLSTCHQPHNHGYIATTESGELTNIGNICGKNHFGIAFEEFSRKFDERLTDHNNREYITSFQSKITAHLKSIHELRTCDKGADWVYRNTRPFLINSTNCPERIFNEIKRMIRDRNGKFSTYRLATNEEIKELEAIQNKSIPLPHYIEEPTGILRGLTCLFSDYDLREILIKDLTENLKKLTTLDITNSLSQELKHWSKWIQGFDKKIERAKTATKAGNAFLKRNNIIQLQEILTSSKEKTEFRKWILRIKLK